MHETSIVLSILDTITRRCTEEGYSAIESVRLRIGMASGILPEAIVFAFEAAKLDTIADGAQLFIDRVMLGGTCHTCNGAFEVDEKYVFNCPLCGSQEIRIEKGYEMEIVDIDVQ